MNTMDGSGAQKLLSVRDNAAHMDKLTVGKTTIAMKTQTNAAHQKLHIANMKILASLQNNVANMINTNTMFSAQSLANAKMSAPVVNLDQLLANATVEKLEQTKPATILMDKNVAMMFGAQDLMFALLAILNVVKLQETLMLEVTSTMNLKNVVPMEIPGLLECQVKMML